MKVYMSSIDLIANNLPAYAKMLNSAQQARAARFKTNTRRAQFILGHLMANATGKRYISFGYLDDMVVVAASNTAPVGIAISDATAEYDMESITRDMNLPESKTQNEFLRNMTFARAKYKIGAHPWSRLFMRYGKYIICMCSSRVFDMPKLNKYTPKLK